LEEGLVVIDQHERIAYMNQTAEQLTGLSHTQVYRKLYTDLFHANPWATEILRRTVASGYSRTSGEGELTDEIYVLLQFGLPVRRFLLARRVLRRHSCPPRSELSKGASRNSPTKDRLTQLGVVAAGLAHEIKNPLAGIRGAAQLLQGRVKSDQSAVEYAGIMIREIGPLEQLAGTALESHLLTSIGNPSRQCAQSAH